MHHGIKAGWVRKRDHEGLRMAGVTDCWYVWSWAVTVWVLKVVSWRHGMCWWTGQDYDRMQPGITSERVTASEEQQCWKTYGEDFPGGPVVGDAAGAGDISCVPQLLRPAHPGALQRGKPTQQESSPCPPPLATAWESPCVAMKTHCSQKYFFFF